MKLRLQIIDAPATPVYEFTGSTVTIGRDNACELSLKGTVNQNVSGKHAQIVLTAEGVFLVDLKSTNGTFLNDHRVDGRKLLRQGDQFRLGHTGPRLQVLEVVLANAAESAVPATVMDNRPARDGVSAPKPKPCAPVMIAAKESVKPAAPRKSPAPAASEPSLSAAAPGQTRLMVVSLQKANRRLMIGAGLAIIGLVVVGVVVVLYQTNRMHDLSSKTADLGDTAKGLQKQTETLNQTVGNVSKNFEKFTKKEEANIFGRYAGAVYLVAGYDKAGKVVPIGTAFAVCRDGKLGTNGHVAFPVNTYLKKGIKVVAISPGGKKEYPVTEAIWHPDYKEWPDRKILYQTPDVGVLTVGLPAGDSLPKVVERATEEELRKLTPEAQLCYIGFPGWSDYSSLKKVAPHVYTGPLTRLTTLKEESGDFSNQYLLTHDMSSFPGASGSPIFNRDGKVVGIHNSGQMHQVAGFKGGVANIAVGPKTGIRIDLLKDILK